MSAPVYMPHAGHFICGHLCRFRLNTYVNGFIISTVGEYHPTVGRDANKRLSQASDGQLLARKDREPPEEIGWGRLYETMVFRGVPSKEVCCPFEAESGNNIDFAGYGTAADATLGHAEMVEKWSVPGVSAAEVAP